MRFERDLQIEIARRAAVHARPALAAQAQALAVHRALRDARAQRMAVDLELALRTARGLFERDAYRRLPVLAGDRHVAAEAAAAARGAAEDAHLLEEVREVDVAQVFLPPGAEAVEPVGRRPEILAGTEPRAERVVGRALFLVAQCLVSLGDLLELLLGVRLFGNVRVVLARELPVRLLDLILAGAALDAEDLVVILVFHPGYMGTAPPGLKFPPTFSSRPSCRGRCSVRRGYALPRRCGSR